MELLEAIKGRRSTRAFKKQTIPDNAIETLIEAARCAPSAGNIQPWEFVIVKNQTVRKKLAEAALNQRHVEEAPVVIVVCADEKRSSMGYGSRNTKHPVGSSFPWAWNMLGWRFQRRRSEGGSESSRRNQTRCNDPSGPPERSYTTKGKKITESDRAL